MNKCEVCESESYVSFRKKWGKFLCQNHMRQLNKYGFIQEDRGETGKCEVCGGDDNVYFRKKWGRFLCQNHMHQMNKYGFIQEDRGETRKCEVCGGNDKVNFRGKWGKMLCQKHLQQMNRFGYILKDKVGICDICRIKDADTKRIASTNMEYCVKHYAQINKYGKIFERTRFDTNKIVNRDGFSEMILYDDHGNEKAVTKIDNDDIDRVSDSRWSLTGGYVANGKNGLLHRFIFRCEDGLIIDHINRDKLDNRKSNLRLASVSENNMNRKLNKGNTSGYTGVSPNGKAGAWKACIGVDKKPLHLGTFANIEDALITRLQAEKKYYGKFAPQIHLFEKYNI